MATAPLKLQVHEPTVRQLMKDRGLSLRELARRLGSDHGDLSRVLNGKMPLTWDFALRLSFALSAAPLAAGPSPITPDVFATIEPVFDGQAA